MDHDSNGWPQTPRNDALRAMRRGVAFHIAGDQHLGSSVHYGIDDWNDAVAICVPSVANIFPRRWFPPYPGKNQGPGAPKYTGEFLDGFGNKMTVANGIEPDGERRGTPQLMERAPGYGIITFDRADPEDRDGELAALGGPGRAGSEALRRVADHRAAAHARG